MKGKKKNIQYPIIAVDPEVTGKKIILIRGRKVLIDDTLAKLYGVSTK